MNRSIFLLFIVCFTYCSCNRKPADEFYTDHGDWDDVRIPFIKPYEAIKLNGKINWDMNLYWGSMEGSVQNIKEARVIKGIILLYSAKTLLDNDYTKNVWYIIIPQKHLQKAFRTHDDYVSYLTTLGITSEPELYDMDYIADYYGDHDIMKWNEIK